MWKGALGVVLTSSVWVAIIAVLAVIAVGFLQGIDGILTGAGGSSGNSDPFGGSTVANNWYTAPINSFLKLLGFQTNVEDE